MDLLALFLVATGAFRTLRHRQAYRTFRRCITNSPAHLRCNTHKLRPTEHRQLANKSALKRFRRSQTCTNSSNSILNMDMRTATCHHPSITPSRRLSSNSASTNQSTRPIVQHGRASNLLHGADMVDRQSKIRWMRKMPYRPNPIPGTSHLRNEDS